MAAALVGMVARLTVGKKKFAGVEARMRGVAAAADGLRERLQQAVASDSEAFDAVMAARRMPKGTEAEKRSREAALEAAMRHAGEVPLGVARDAAAALGLAAEVAESGNPSAASDAGSAGALARAALTAATMNVRVNADGLKDEDAAAAWRTALESLEARAAEAEERLGRAFDARLGPTAR
jgi:glutamate formiminotransferase/formiminotetrahydrofolate cyclodeaminase